MNQQVAFVQRRSSLVVLKTLPPAVLGFGGAHPGLPGRNPRFRVFVKVINRCFWGRRFGIPERCRQLLRPGVVGNNSRNYLTVAANAHVGVQPKRRNCAGINPVKTVVCRWRLFLVFHPVCPTWRQGETFGQPGVRRLVRAGLQGRVRVVNLSQQAGRC